MHKSKLAVGIGVIVLGSIPLLINVGLGIYHEMEYDVCVYNEQHFQTWHASIPCMNFLAFMLHQIWYVMAYIGIISIGIFVLFCGIKSISLKSFSRE